MYCLATVVMVHLVMLLVQHDIIMPVAGLLTGGVDFTKFIALNGESYANLMLPKGWSSCNNLW
jgi:large-conductance mechanosensitive channel